jgi:hypothetical protein
MSLQTDQQNKMATACAQDTDQVITLRGSTDIVTEFFFFCINRYSCWHFVCAGSMNTMRIASLSLCAIVDACSILVSSLQGQFLTTIAHPDRCLCTRQQCYNADRSVSSARSFELFCLLQHPVPERYLPTRVLQQAAQVWLDDAGHRRHRPQGLPGQRHQAARW